MSTKVWTEEEHRLGELLLSAWQKAEPSHGVSLHPESYRATFFDMARAVLAEQAKDEQATNVPDELLNRLAFLRIITDPEKLKQIAGVLQGVLAAPPPAAQPVSARHAAMAEALGVQPIPQSPRDEWPDDAASAAGHLSGCLMGQMDGDELAHCTRLIVDTLRKLCPGEDQCTAAGKCLHNCTGPTEPTIHDAIAAGDGTLHGAIDHWQQRALKAEQALGSGSELVVMNVTQQGAVRINAAHAHRKAPGIVCIYVDLHSKRVEAPIVGSGSNDQPALYFSAGKYGLLLDESKPRDSMTVVEFPEYAGWSVFACDGPSRYTLSVVLVYPEQGSPG